MLSIKMAELHFTLLLRRGIQRKCVFVNVGNQESLPDGFLFLRIHAALK